MTESTRELLERALQLDATERALLVAELVASLDVGEEPQEQVEAAWASELERRVRQMPPSGAGLRGAEEVFARLRTHLQERRRRAPRVVLRRQAIVEGMDQQELNRRLEQAAQARARLRLATRELRAFGAKVLAKRANGPQRPDDRLPARR